MLRKRNRTVHSQSDSSTGVFFPSDMVAPKPRGSSFFSVHRLLARLCAKGLPDSEYAKSPTSHLEYRAFSSLSSSFSRSPRSPSLDGGNRKSWECSRVGLRGLVDSLSDEDEHCERKVIGVSLSKNILFGPQAKINTTRPSTLVDAMRDDTLGAAPKSLPKDFGVSSLIRLGSPYSKLGSLKVEQRKLGKAHSCTDELLYQLRDYDKSEVFPLDSNDSQLEPPPLSRGGMDFDNFSGGSLLVPKGLSDGFEKSLSASEIEQSEDYTCIISHGPNPKTTHIFGDRILENHTVTTCKNEIEGDERSPWLVKCSQDSAIQPPVDFLGFCFSCKKKLEGEDIYIYRHCICVQWILILIFLEYTAEERSHSAAVSAVIKRFFTEEKCKNQKKCYTGDARIE